MDEPGPIPEWIKKRFEHIQNAQDNGQLALISARTAAEGHQVYLLAALVRHGEEFSVLPFGHLVCPDNPYLAYVDPTIE